MRYILLSEMIFSDSNNVVGAIVEVMSLLFMAFVVVVGCAMGFKLWGSYKEGRLLTKPYRNDWPDKKLRHLVGIAILCIGAFLGLTALFGAIMEN